MVSVVAPVEVLRREHWDGFEDAVVESSPCVASRRKLGRGLVRVCLGGFLGGPLAGALGGCWACSCLVEKRARRRL